jgi:hypothetical protein
MDVGVKRSLPDEDMAKVDLAAQSLGFEEEPSARGNE